jgi:hypothetical protein
MNKASRTLGLRREPFPNLAWHGLALISDLPECERNEFRDWLKKNNQKRQLSEPWPFVKIVIPPGYGPSMTVENLYATRDHLDWKIEKAFKEH